MKKKILDHYLKFGLFTNPGCYEDFFEALPDSAKEIGKLISHQVIHRLTLQEGNTGSNKDGRYGDMKRFPWYRLVCDDDVLPNTVSMVAELLRLDKRGFVMDRKVENKIVVTCRHVAILMASILKSKGISCRVRSGFAPYFLEKSVDHWINEYWNKEKKKWIVFDASAIFDELCFDPYDIPKNKFDWAANVWLGIREGKLNVDNFVNAGGFRGITPVVWELFYDFHSLMNNEILYKQAPYYLYDEGDFKKLTKKDFVEIDDLAELLLEPDKNFEALVDTWNKKKKFRILNSPLIDDEDHCSKLG
ncbi:transglutaminase domain-containing protein [Patescibacteria group bacterium]|nr:transglutaminase domain-containing protein [Patescibacteria group bacterium]